MAESPKIPPGAPSRAGERSIWLIAGTGAFLAAVFVVWLFSHAPAPPAATPASRPAPAVGLSPLNAAGTDAVVREQAEMFDPTPLFLPTHWNARPRGLPAGVARGPGDTVFEDFPPMLTFDENALALSFPAAIRTPGQPIEALAVGTLPRPLLGFGQVDLAASTLPPRGGFLEVQAADTGESVLAGDLPAAAPPAGDWAPLEFLVALDPAGIIGAPQLVHGSGRSEVDAYFRMFLLRNFRLGARLPPGFFRICIGP